MQAAISGSRETKRAFKKSRVAGGIEVPVLAASAFQHMLAMDKALRTTEEDRINLTQNLTPKPSEVHVPVEHVSSSLVSNLQHMSYTGDQRSGQGSGVHIHIHVTPPQAQRQVQQDNITVEPLVRAKRILEFGSTAPNTEVGQAGPGAHILDLQGFFNKMQLQCNWQIWRSLLQIQHHRN